MAQIVLILLREEQKNGKGVGGEDPKPPGSPSSSGFLLERIW